ncbi:hypothetical protein DSO57_1011347 [Entomophthora muscae]|uniref:Uncharacterized protein n=1 Tax=Entomophthora muscae TaxID=34485 RepID=A0ACC2U4G4_9FUNG|nr:hypothetical protein DSO57_1011347 [Entomophthora muscae]
MSLWFEQILPYLVLEIFHLNSSQVDNTVPACSRDQPADPLLALYHPPEALFEPVHIIKYSPNPVYLEYNLENMLIANPLARTRKTKIIECKGKWYVRLPRLFKDKYNFLPAYLVPMTLPLTPQPNRPMEPAADETTSIQQFGVLYITMTGLMGSMVPNSGPWFLLRQYLSYINKLAHILWWVLPTGPVVPCPKSPNAYTYSWLPETYTSVCFPMCGEKTSFMDMTKVERVLAN